MYPPLRSVPRTQPCLPVVVSRAYHQTTLLLLTTKQWMSIPAAACPSPTAVHSFHGPVRIFAPFVKFNPPAL